MGDRPAPQQLPELERLVRQLDKYDFSGHLLALDPGETTGYALFHRRSQQSWLISAGQIQTWPFEDCVRSLTLNFQHAHSRPSQVVYEVYHVYGWRLQEHSFSEIPTIQIIGCIKTLCVQNDIPYHGQTAQVGKGFCSDQKLRYWGLYQPGLVHARDAIRHGCHYLLFGPSKAQS